MKIVGVFLLLGVFMCDGHVSRCGSRGVSRSGSRGVGIATRRMLAGRSSKHRNKHNKSYDGKTVMRDVTICWKVHVFVLLMGFYFMYIYW